MLIVLTAGDIGNTIVAEEVIVKSIRIIGVVGTVAGHDYRIDDPVTGLPLFRTVAAGAWYVEESITQRHWRNGFALGLLDSGEMHIETEPHDMRY